MRWAVVPAALLVVLGACSGPLAAPPAPAVASAVRDATPTPASGPATGQVTVAQPDPVGSWRQRSPEDVAAGDLAALWSLPLQRTDPLGRPVPALALDARVVDGTAPWTVEVDLATGTWSDGEPVGADDVVATADALAADRPAAWAAFVGASVVGPHTVQLGFDRPFAGWARLLSDPPGVLPAHVLADGGLAQYDERLPVTGGWFSLDGRDPGLRASFVAHEGSPLGAPGVAEVEVLVVPDHETALGLLGDGTVDLVTGHVVVDPVARRAAVPDVVGASVFGGTRFELVWDTERSSRDVRVAAAGLDPVPLVTGLLRDGGRAPGGLVPAHARLRRPSGGGSDASVTVQVVRTVEGLGLLARRLQADLETAGAGAGLVRLDPPEHLDPPVVPDARLRVVRVAPDRPLAPLLGELGLDPGDGLAADAAGIAGSDPMATGVAPPAQAAAVATLLEEDPRLLPVAEVAVTHVWHPERIGGVRPSAWPGIAFWNAGEWTAPDA